jgi:hypothetical protein
MQMRPVVYNDQRVFVTFAVCLSAVPLLHRRPAFVRIDSKSIHSDGHKIRGHSLYHKSSALLTK